jgi:hypothetical protein
MERNDNVQVKKGLFSVLLGSVNNLPANIFDSSNRWFGVKVGDDPEMNPKQQITATPFAFRAAVANTVDDGAITTAKMADGAITKAKLAHDATSDVNETIKTGWIPAGEAWVTTGTTDGKGTITISGDKTGIYEIGDKIRFKQLANSVNYYYGYIYAVALNGENTIISYIVDIRNVATNAPISLNYFSKASSPVDFPGQLNYTPALTNASGVSGLSSTGLFSIEKNMITVSFQLTFNQTGNSLGVGVILPLNNNSGIESCGIFRLYSAVGPKGNRLGYGSNGTSVYGCFDSNTAGPETWINSTGYIITGQVTYQL